MTLNPTTRFCVKPILFALLIAAILVRGLVPIGYMPDIASGLFKITICTENGAQEIAWNGNGDHQDGNRKSVCDFTGLISAFILPPVILPVLFPLPASFSGARNEQPDAVRENGAFQSRAPPIFN